MFSNVKFNGRRALLVALALGLLTAGGGFMALPKGPVAANKATLGDTSRTGPALAAFNGRLYIAWKETDGRLNVMAASDGMNFGGKHTFGDTSVGGPALAGSGGGISLAWTGTDSEHHLNVKFALGGDTQTLPETSIGGPALAVFNDQVYLAWTGADSEGHLNVQGLTGGGSPGVPATADASVRVDRGCGPGGSSYSFGSPITIFYRSSEAGQPSSTTSIRRGP